MALKTIPMSDLYDMIDKISPKAIVLDVRSPEEYAAGHIKGSRNIPHDQVGGRLDQLKGYELIYIHCRSGARATAAAQTLINAGFNNIVCITGSGMADWIACGLPVERNT